MAFITLIVKGSRQAGSYLSAAIPVVNTGLQFKVSTKLDLNKADLEDVNLTIQIAIEGTVDNINWITLVGGVWHAGKPARDGTFADPIWSWATTGQAPIAIRFSITLPRTLVVGAEVEVIA